MKKSLVLALCVAAALAGCGGGGDDSPPAATDGVPSGATATITGFIAYLKVLVVSSADMLEPIDVSSVTPPTDDTAEPDPLN